MKRHSTSPASHIAAIGGLGIALLFSGCTSSQGPLVDPPPAAGPVGLPGSVDASCGGGADASWCDEVAHVDHLVFGRVTQVQASHSPWFVVREDGEYRSNEAECAAFGVPAVRLALQVEEDYVGGLSGEIEFFVGSSVVSRWDGNPETHWVTGENAISPGQGLGAALVRLPDGALSSFFTKLFVEEADSGLRFQAPQCGTIRDTPGTRAEISSAVASCRGEAVARFDLSEVHPGFLKDARCARVAATFQPDQDACMLHADCEAPAICGDDGHCE